MARVTGIGGIFFKAKDPVALREWYRRHLEMDVSEWGGVVFEWNKPEPTPDGMTIWSVSPESSSSFGSSTASFMINYRVADLESVLAALRAEGCEVEEMQDSEYGKFGWVTDPEGNRVELWQPPAESAGS